MQTIVMRYVNPNAYLPAVPARDLTEEDMQSLQLDADTLAATGVYQKVEAVELPAANAVEEPTNTKKGRK